MKLVNFSLLASAVIFAGNVFAAEVKGNVDTNVKVGAVVQSAQGIANKQKANLGSVSGNAKVGGNFKSNVKAGAVIQSAQGIANQQEANLGSVVGK